MDLLEEINQFRTNNNFGKLKITDPILIKKLHDLYFKDINDDTIKNKHHYGVYYSIKEDYDNMMKYYLMAIENGNMNSMSNLAVYYYEQKDYDNMMKYYLMAVEKDSIMAICNLGKYYQEQKDYDNMMKYYLIGIKKGNKDAMNNLGVYYSRQKEYDNMMKYYLMAIKKGNILAINNLGVYYKNNDKQLYEKFNNFNNDEKILYATCQLAEWYKKHNDTENMLKYYNKAYKKGVIDAFYKILDFYKNDRNKLMEIYNLEKDCHKRKIMEEYFIMEFGILFI